MQRVEPWHLEHFSRDGVRAEHSETPDQFLLEPHSRWEVTPFGDFLPVASHELVDRVAVPYAGIGCRLRGEAADRLAAAAGGAASRARNASSRCEMFTITPSPHG